MSLSNLFLVPISVVSIVLVSGCSTTNALESRVKDLERQVEELQRATSELSSKVDEANNGLFILKDRMEAQMSSLESRKQSELSKAKTSSPSKSGDASRVYKQAMSLYNSQEYEGGLKEFDKVLREYPKNKLAGNARYWRGECYYALRDYSRALNEFQKVMEDYPESNKVPDALLKIGFTHLQLGDKKQAIDYLEKVIREHPYSEASKKAEERLKEATRE